MRTVQRKSDGTSIRSAWPLVTKRQHAAIVAHVERMLEMALARQAKSELAHRRLLQESTRKSMEYDTAVCQGLRWALDLAMKRPTSD